MKKTNTPILAVNQISFSYDRNETIFSNVSFSLNHGEIFTILGANGAGKSTLLACLERQLKPESGVILLEGENTAGMSASALARKVGFISQVQSIAFEFTVRDYLVLGRAPHLGMLKLPGKYEYEIVDNVMQQMGITYLAHKSITRISGGERQQVQIARVLVQRPKLILMDEPTNHLDYGNQVKVLKMIVALAEEEKMAIVITTHVPDHAIMLGSKVGILDCSGQFIEGSAESIVTQDNLNRIYQTNLRMVYVKEVERLTCLACNIRN